MTAEQTIGLAEAGRRLRMAYQDAHRALLTGQLEGEKRGGRWYVTVRSVEGLRKSRETDEAAKA
jgi:hypothetical protein